LTSDLPSYHQLRLSVAGRWLLAVVAAGLGIGIALPAPALAALAAMGLGAIALAGLASSFELTAIRRGAVRVQPVLDGTESKRAGRPTRLRVGHPVNLSWTFDDPHGRIRRFGAVEPRLTAGLTIDSDSVLRGGQNPGDPLVCRIVARRAGLSHILGVTLRGPMAGALFEGIVDIPGFLPVRVPPSAVGSSRSPLFDATRASSDSSRDVVVRRPRGAGLEIRELREFAVGDPYKHIAWQATARRGYLMVREFETDARLSAWLIIDVSPSMYWGAPGKAPVDRAVSVAAMAADALLRGRDRVGLILVDHRVRLVVEPGQGAAQRQRVLAGLMEVHGLLHEDRTEITHGELLRSIEAWFHFQRGTVFRLPAGGFQGRAPGLTDIDEGRLIEACDAMTAELERQAAPRRSPVDAFADVPTRTRLRNFCRLAGVSVPLEQESRPGGQAQGLVEALETIMRLGSRGSGRAQTIITFSDLLTTSDQPLLTRAALVSRRQRHQLVFVVPTRRWELAAADGAGHPSHIFARVLRAQTHLDAQRRREVEACLRPAGASFVSMDEEDGLARTLLRIRNTS